MQRSSKRAFHGHSRFLTFRYTRMFCHNRYVDASPSLIGYSDSSWSALVKFRPRFVYIINWNGWKQAALGNVPDIRLDTLNRKVWYGTLPAKSLNFQELARSTWLMVSSKSQYVSHKCSVVLITLRNAEQRASNNNCSYPTRRYFEILVHRHGLYKL